MNADSAPSGPDISAALREILLLRAVGKIDAEEFERRQAALHAALLEPESAPTPTSSTVPPAPDLPRVDVAAPGTSAPPRASSPGAAGLPPKIVWVVVAAIAGFAVAMTLWMQRGGSSRMVSAPAPAAAPASGGPPMTGAPGGGAQGGAQPRAGGDLTVMVKRLAEKMAADPKNGEGWLLLARTYGELRQPREAAEAYGKAAALLPADAGLLADWAAVLVATGDGKWNDEARGVLKRALAADARHLKALALAGAEAYERGDLRAAVGHWEQLQKLAAPDSPDAKLAQANLAEARTRLSGDGKSSGGVKGKP